MQTKIRSRTGLAASIAFLSLLPVAILYQAALDTGIEIAIHIVLATGTALLSRAVFDFRTPRWMAWITCLSTAILAVIFTLQAISLSLPSNEQLAYFAFRLLGQGIEGLLGNLFLLWCAAVLVTGRRGKTRAFGFLAVGLAICGKIYEYASRYRGETAPEALKLLMLLIFVWLLLESRKPDLEGRQL